MAWPEPVVTLWRDLEAVRADVLKEVEGLSQAQADWKPGDDDWSVGEIVHHLTIAEIATGKLTTKLTREADAAGALKPFPADLRELRPLSAEPAASADAPAVVWPSRATNSAVASGTDSVSIRRVLRPPPDGALRRLQCVRRHLRAQAHLAATSSHIPSGT